MHLQQRNVQSFLLDGNGALFDQRNILWKIHLSVDVCFQIVHVFWLDFGVEAAIDGFLYDGHGDLVRHRPNLANMREHLAICSVLRAQALGEGYMSN